MINDLPLHLLDEILFRLEPKSLVMMQCTNRSIKSHISDDPNFEICYSSRAKSYLFNLCRYIASYVDCHPGKEDKLVHNRYYIFGSCFGLLLIYIDGLYIMNPLTKRSRFVDHSGSKLLSEIVGGDGKTFWDYPQGNIADTTRAMCVGFAVNQNQTTMRFKIVCILEMQTTYAFEISDGDSWRLSETTIATKTSKSDLTMRMKPVYLNGILHWLRNDGSIIAFDPETEQARLIPSEFHQKPEVQLFFASDDKINLPTLISGTIETISVNTLLGNTKWALARQIKNAYMNKSTLISWNVVVYDGKRLVVDEIRHSTTICLKSVMHVYDMEANSWEVLRPTSIWANNNRDFCKFTPSLSAFEKSEQNKVFAAFNTPHFFFNDLNRFLGLTDLTTK